MATAVVGTTTVPKFSTITVAQRGQNAIPYLQLFIRVRLTKRKSVLSDVDVLINPELNSKFRYFEVPEGGRP